MGTILAVALIALMVAVWVTVVWTIPTAERSHLRLRLWTFRDQLWDEIHADAFENSQPAAALLAETEAAIVSAHKIMSPAKLIWFAVACRISGMFSSFGEARKLALQHAEDEERMLASLGEQDRKRMQVHLDEYRSILTRHFFLRTYSGWFAVAMVVPLFVFLLAREIWKVGAVRAAAFRTAKGEVRDDLALDGAVFVLARQERGATPELSAFV